MVKVGVVGLGEMGQNHARVYSQLNCELVGAVDVNPERAREIGEKYDTEYYTDFNDLLFKVDAVSIVVPTILHHTISQAFLNEGVHCLVEKPIASRLDFAEEMIQTAKTKHSKLMIGHIERFNPAVQKLKQLIKEGKLGKIIMISTRRVGPLATRIRDVGIIVDSATHDIDVIRYLLGKEPFDMSLGVFSKFGSFRHGKEDYAIIVLDFEDTAASIEVNWFTPYKVRTLVATGSEGIAYLDYINQTIEFRNSSEIEIIDIQRTEPLKLELEHFLQCVENDEMPLVDGIEGLKVLQIALEATRKSALVKTY